MPTPQLLTAMLEDAINRVLSLDEESAERCKPLQGKRLQVDLQELPFELLFVVTSKIDVLTIPREKNGEKLTTSTQPKAQPEVDCVIACSLFTLPELRNVANLTSLIKSEKLQLEGDIQVAQQFSQLFKRLDIDWEEQMSTYTGDVLAHQTVTMGKTLLGKLEKLVAQASVAMRDAAIEEKGIAAPKTLVDRFNDEVFDLQGRVRKLENRIAAMADQ